VAHDAHPREWIEREIALLEETAERTWAAVERARAEAALRASEERLRRALSIETVGVLFFRLDGTILDANAALERLTGHTTEELRAIRHWEVLTPPEFMAATERTAADLAERGTAAPYEKQFIRKDGSRFWGLFAPTRLAGTGSASECVEFIVDVTARREAEAAVRETEARFRALAETSPLGVGVSSAEGRIIYTNRAYEAILGYEPGGLLGQAATAVYYDPADRQVWLAAMREKGRVPDYEVRFRRSNGRPVWVSINVAPIEFGGRPGILGVVQDVTERKQVEAERERLAVAEAVAAERQALLKRIVRAQEDERARISREIHDSITQLAHAAAIHLDNAVDLLDGTPTPARAEVERSRDLARQAANEARRLIAGLRPEMLDLAGLAGAIRQEVDALRRAGWRVDLEDGLQSGVRLNPEAEITLFRVAQEALSNVRKHAGHTRVRVRLKRTNGSLQLEVRDWGRGFAPHSVHPTAEGEHVGLTGMRERMGLLGGKLEVRSDPETGTTIRASLPISGRDQP
jgi:PAS domain S-box-containing protein